MQNDQSHEEGDKVKFSAENKEKLIAAVTDQTLSSDIINW